MKKKFIKNLQILEDNGISMTSPDPVWEDKPYSVELETHTNAGEDMIIHLEEPTKKCLLEYCDDFDVNEEVILWWYDGVKAAKKKGVPFDNIKEHYEDYEAYLEELRRVAELLD